MGARQLADSGLLQGDVKVMRCSCPLLFPELNGKRNHWATRVAAASTLPLFAALAVTAKLSLRAKGGDDCLGYAVLARRPE